MSYCASLLCFNTRGDSDQICGDCKQAQAEYAALDLDLELDLETPEKFQGTGFFHRADFEAEIFHHFPLKSAHLIDAWDSVVQIGGIGISKRTGRLTKWSGTGFFINRPPHVVQYGGNHKTINTKVHVSVMTNGIVVNDKVTDARLWAKFDDGTVIPLDTHHARRFSAPGAESLEYVTLDLIPTDAQLPKLLKLRALHWEESARLHLVPVETPLIIIGHPHGAQKHGSFGKITQEKEAGAVARFNYNVEAIRPGNSGSPVFFLSREHDLTGKFVCAIHFNNGSGVAYVGGVAEAIKAQFAAGPEEVTHEEWDRIINSPHFEVV